MVRQPYIEAPYQQECMTTTTITRINGNYSSSVTRTKDNGRVTLKRSTRGKNLERVYIGIGEE